MGKTRVAVTDVFVVLGIFAGFVFAAFGPHTHTSQTLVVVPASRNVAAQVVIAHSNQVLEGAQRRIGPAVSLASLRRHVHVKSVTSAVILISAQGRTDASAENIANAVADSYVAFGNGQQHLKPVVLGDAAMAREAPLSHRLLVPCGLGGLIGALIGGMTAIIGRGRRLRTA
jgi:capsular polysaccharide biosynthesis protein